MTVDQSSRPRSRRPTPGEPTWDIAQLFPPQGTWSVEQYLNLNTNHLVEFSDGVLEFLPMPTEFHQLLMLYIYNALKEFVLARRLGMVMTAPMKVRVDERHFREPDVLFMRAEHASRRGNPYWDGADLVVEVVSPDDPDRDFEDKRREYAQAGIPEYWIVDPMRRTVHVLTLTGREYVEHGRFVERGIAASALLDGFVVDVAKMFESVDADRSSGRAED